MSRIKRVEGPPEAEPVIGGTEFVAAGAEPMAGGEER
jgi:hypothetical protein